MKTVLYYFTGTGNSLAVAKKIAATLGDTELVPVAMLAETSGEIVPSAERVGIVCPVYFAGLPVMVAEVAGRLRLSGAARVFAVITHGGGGGAAALRQLDGILRRHASRGPDAGYSIMMPGNYILMYESPQGTKREEILAAADREIARITEEIRQDTTTDLPRSLPTQIIYTLAYGWFASHARGKDREFSVADTCTACGTCVAVCPARNIRLVDKKPVFRHRCEVCCACIHACPVQAINAGPKTAARQRYRNPSVTVADLKLFRGESV